MSKGRTVACRRRSPRIFVLALLVTFLVAASAGAQSSTGPRKSDCRQWDTSFTRTFEFGLLFAGAGCACGGLILGSLFAPRSWLFASPMLRNLIVSVVVLVLAIVVLVAAPLWAGQLDSFPFSAVDIRYQECKTAVFQAPGFLQGRIGSGTAAIAQPLTLIGLVLGSCFLGWVVAMLVTGLVTRSSGVLKLKADG